MKYVELLKEQIGSYLANLDRHDSAMSEAVQILEEKATTAKGKYAEGCRKTEEALQSAKVKKERMTAIRESVGMLSAQLRQKIVEYTKYAAELQKNSNDSGLREKVDACDREIQGKYAELLALRKEYAENYASIADDPREAEDLLEKERKKAAKQHKAQWEDISVLKLIPYMDTYEKMMTQRYLDLLPHVALDSQILKGEEYPELLLLAALCTRKAETALCVPDLKGDVSVVCAKQCREMCSDMAAMQDRLCNFWTAHAYREEKAKNFEFAFLNGAARPQAYLENSYGKSSYLLFTREFLEKLLEVLQEDQDYDLFTLYERLIKIGEEETNSTSEEIYPDRDAERSLQNAFKEFKRLYEETPEERLVTEQRYYQQKLLEEAREKNRLLERQMEEERERYEEEQREEERRYREEQRERRREQERQEQREWEQKQERDRERRREEERERARKQEQRRAEDAKRKEESDRVRREMSDTRHQCNTCANAGHCSSFMHRPNCAAYRPRRSR